jgi:hypothetical protein
MADERLEADGSSKSARPIEPGARRLGHQRSSRGPEGANRRAFTQLASVVIAVAAITAYVQYRPKIAGPPRPPEVSVAEPIAARPAVSEPDMADEATPTPGPPDQSPASDGAMAVHETPEAPKLDQAAVGAAETTLDMVSRDRARADHRAAESARRLALTSAQTALDASRARKLAFVVRDPSTRIALAAARGGFLRGERDKLEKDVTTLRQLPRPKSASILSKSPVAKPAGSDESHFELKRNRVSFIDLDHLMELTLADAKIRIRMSDRMPGISNKVGPVGAFSLEYELVRAVPGSMDELISRKSVRFELRAWELVAESENRGETYDATQNPISEFARAVNRITPGRTTITLWVYPDSFTLYRRIRADLVDRGFSVAARPLPEGLTIRGSPMGTQSAAQ